MKRLRALFFLLFITALLLVAWLVPIEELMNQVQQWAETNKSYAFLVVTAFIALGILLMLPASILMMLAGFLFGLSQGLAVVWFAGLLASSLAFWTGRSLARPWVERKLARKSTFMAIDRAIQRKGLLVVLLTRLVMVLPYPPMNYTLGLTKVSFRNYLLGTNIGMLPPMFLMVYLGTTVSDIAAIMRGDIKLEGNELIVAAVALGAVLLIVGFIIRAARTALRQELMNAESPEPAQSDH